MHFWDAGTRAGGWAGTDHQLTLHPAHVPGLSPCGGSSVDQGLGLCWRAVLAWVGWWFTHSMSLGTAGLGEDIGIGVSGMVCAHDGIGGLFAERLHYPLRAQGLQEATCESPIFKLLWEKSLTCTTFPPCPGFLYSCIVHGREKTSGYKLSPDQGFKFPIIVKTGKGCCRTCAKRTLISSP